VNLRHDFLGTVSNRIIKNELRGVSLVDYARSCSSSIPTKEVDWINSAVRTPTTT